MQVWLVSELCRGSLSDYVRHFGTLVDPEPTLWFKDLCTGLGHLFQCSVIHRDVKPQNVLVQRSQPVDHLKIGDFGNSCIATLESAMDGSTEELKKGLCTFNYAAPEILKESTYGFTCDVFNASVLMYELLQEDPTATVIALDKKDSMAEVLPRTQAFIGAVASQVQNSDMKELALIHAMLQEFPEARRDITSILQDPLFTPTGLGGDKSLGNHQQLCSAGLEDEKLPPGTHKESQAQVAPDANILELFNDAVPILLACTLGDRTAFLTRVPLLGQHKEHVLLQYILASAQYPSIMEIVAKQYSNLPAKLTAASLKAASHRVIILAEVTSKDDVLRHEMSLFDDENKTAVVGLPKVLEQLGLLQEVDSSQPAPTCCFTLTQGRGKPGIKYTLAYDQKLLTGLLEQTSSFCLPSHLSNEIILRHVEELGALLRCLPTLRTKVTARAEAAAKPLPKIQKQKSVPARRSKVKAKVAKRGLRVMRVRRRINAKSSEPPFKHFLGKHISWLVEDRVGQGGLDWGSMTIDQLYKLVPDQAAHATGLGAYGVHTAADLSTRTSQNPLLALCMLCSLRPLMKGNIGVVLSDKANHTRLMEIVNKHVEDYKMPPSLVWLVRRFNEEQAPASSPTSVVTALPPLEPALAPAAGANAPDAGSKRTAAALGGVPGRHTWYATQLAKDPKQRCACSGNCSSRLFFIRGGARFCDDQPRTYG